MKLVVEITDNTSVVPQAFLKERLGEPVREHTVPSWLSATSIREWSCGCLLVVKATYDFEIKAYRMFQEYVPCRGHESLFNELVKLLKKNKVKFKVEK